MTSLTARLQAIFEDNSDEFQRRVSTLEDAVAAISDGNLEEDLRAAAERDAHKLAGSFGTFGMARASEFARELEQRLAPGQRPVLIDATQMTACVGVLRNELDARLAGLPSPEGLAPGGECSEAGLSDAHVRAATPGRILVVDDDLTVRHALACILDDAGYDVRDVGSAAEARQVLKHDTIALLLSDVSMPGETGLDLIRFALCEHPETATLLISAIEDPAIAQVAMDYGAYGYLSKPVRRSAVLVGVMNALRRRTMELHERAWRAELESTVRLRTRALSQALERVEVTAEHSRVLQAETIHRWASTAEHRDPGTRRHVMRMSRYCAVLGRRFGLHPESLELASMLHDVGKVAIRDSILLKPGPLTADERLVVETHAEIGYRMLCDSDTSVLDLAAVIAHTHHERYDGSGYPRGLAGEAIPLEGRIAAVADVFDAMTSDRIYRTAWTLDTTLTSMRAQRGKHFDPSVLDAFLDSMAEIRTIQSALTTG